MGTLNESLHVAGTLTADAMSIPANSVTNASITSTADIARTKIAQRPNVKHSIDLLKGVVHDAPQTRLPGTSAADDLGIYGTTFGTTGITWKTYDVGAAGAVTLYGRVQFVLPGNYEDAETVTLRISAAMETAVSDGTATVDVEAYEIDRDGTLSADLCTTAATSFNSVSWADYDFVITPTALIAGDVLDIRITMAINDTATAVCNGAIGALEMLVDTRG